MKSEEHEFAGKEFVLRKLLREATIPYPSLFVLVALIYFTPTGYRAAVAVTGGLLAVAASLPGAWRLGLTLSDKGERAVHVVCAGVPLVLALILYDESLSAWWMGDDPAILRHALEYPLLDFFSDSDTWRTVSSANLTPLLPVSFRLDYAWSGLDPGGFYVHQIGALLAVLFTTYVLMVRWFPPFVAAAATTVLAASVPAATVVQQLTTRHYLEGLLLFLWAVAVFVQSLDVRRWGLTWLAALIYFLACAAKELYVPLVVLLPFLPLGRDWRQRLFFSIPFVVTAAGYTLWRLYMLRPAQVIGGYGSLYQTAPSGLADTWVRLATEMGWTNEWLLALTAASTLLTVGNMIAQRNRGGLIALTASVLLILVPLAPTGPILSAYHLLLLSGLSSFVAGYAVACLARRSHPGRHFVTVTLALLFLASSVAAVAASRPWKDRSYIDRYRAEGQHVLHGDPTQTLLSPLPQSWYFKGLSWIREHVLEGGAAPFVCYQACLCPAHKLTQSVIYEAGGLIPTRPDLDGCRQRVAPLAVTIDYDPEAGEMRWQLGPYDEGRWWYVSPTGDAVFPLPRRGNKPSYLPEPFELRIWYQAPNGWTTVSAPILVDPKDRALDGKVYVRWRRETSAAD